jgi:hypothetical protein
MHLLCSRCFFVKLANFNYWRHRGIILGLVLFWILYWFKVSNTLQCHCAKPVERRLNMKWFESRRMSFSFKLLLLGWSSTILFSPMELAPLCICLLTKAIQRRLETWKQWSLTKCILFSWLALQNRVFTEYLQNRYDFMSHTAKFTFLTLTHLASNANLPGASKNFFLLKRMFSWQVLTRARLYTFYFTIKFEIKKICEPSSE